MQLSQAPVFQSARQLRRRLVQTGWITPSPQVLNIFTTNRCNFSCFYCSRNVEDDAPGIENRYEDKSEFHTPDLELLLTRYPSIREVAFVGIGEPFLIRDLIPMAKLSKERGKRTSVITNASLLHRYWGQLAFSFDAISISLHGLTAMDLKGIAKVKEEVFNQFVENVRYLAREERRLKPTLCVRASVVVLKHNLERAQKAAQFCSENLIPILDLQNYLPYGLDDVDNCVFDDEPQYVAFFEQLAQEFKGTVKINPPTLVKRDDKTLKWGCMTFFNTLRVDGLGQVSGCSRIMVPSVENGNFRSDPDVWENDYFADMRARFKTKKRIPACCRYCPEAQ